MPFLIGKYLRTPSAWSSAWPLALMRTPTGARGGSSPRAGCASSPARGSRRRGGRSAGGPRAAGTSRAAIEPLRAARPEAAPRGQVDQRRRRARDRRQPLGLRPVEPRDRAEQPPCVRVLGVVEEVVLRSALDDPARVHHHDAVGDVGDDPQVVGDEDDRRAEVGLEPPDQLEDLGLDRDVERRRRLVGDQEVGVARERHRDHHPLAHAARELVRVVVDPLLRVGDADGAEQLDRPVAGLRLGAALVRADLLGDLPADPVDRVERGHRVLEDHRDLCAADLAHRVLAELHQVAALVDHLALEHRVRVDDQPHDRHHRDALAGARLADDAQHLALRDREADAVDRADDAVLGAERDLEILDLEQRL